MREGTKDKREYPRAFLSKDEDLNGVLQLTGVDHTKISARILNISQGGVCLLFKQNNQIRIKEGDQIQLKEIQGKPSILYDAKLTLEVIWIFANRSFKNTQIGCKLLNLTEEIKKEIREFVAERIKAQYKPMDRGTTDF